MRLICQSDEMGIFKLASDYIAQLYWVEAWMRYGVLPAGREHILYHCIMYQTTHGQTTYFIHVPTPRTNISASHP